MKYKHCCLLTQGAMTDSPDALAWRRIRRAIEGLPDRMFRFTVERFGEDALHDAWEEFTLGVDSEVEGFNPDSPHVQLFLPWLYHCWSPAEDDGPAVTPTRAYLEERGARLDPLAREYLEACLDAPFSFHEIVRVDPGHGFDTCDILTGEQHAVRQASASRAMEVSDILYGQIVTLEGIAMLEACAPCTIPPARTIDLVDLRKSLPPDAELDAAEWVREIDVELRDLYFLMIGDVLNPPMPELHNTDGDPIEMHRLIFEVDSAQSTFDALAHLAFEATPAELLEAATYAADGQLEAVEFDWAKAGNRQHATWSNTILGHIAIKGTRMTMQVNSAKRARRFRLIVKKAAGKNIRYLVTEIESMEALLEQAAVQRRPAGGSSAQDDHASLAAIPEVREQLQKMMSEHFENWVHRSLPALGGTTPLEALRTPAGKEKVAALVVDAERHARRMNPPVDEDVLQRLRQRLGLNE
ncbi:MAG: DUF2384 domain-containing protein [Proteobacteria bacterium]|nr:DUF2384 domain-containing protein [Pseudomonadota bacterium]